MNNFLFPRGSEWRKWDLHAHTPLDPEWIARPSLRTEGEKRYFAAQYVEAAIRAELAVIAITDHNFW
jgi:predicted metal-dependent phosphoesterase TrpH